MKDTKTIGIRIYLALTVAYIATLFILCSIGNRSISDMAPTFSADNAPQFSTLYSIQKPIATTNIIFYVVLLSVALWLRSKGSKKSLTYLPLLIFSAYTMFCYISMSGMFFSLGGNDITRSGQYWLMFLIGIFFIFGAIGVTVIGNIAMRNLTKHPKAE